MHLINDSLSRFFTILKLQSKQIFFWHFSRHKYKFIKQATNASLFFKLFQLVLIQAIIKKLGVLYPKFDRLCVTDKNNSGILQMRFPLKAFVS